MDDPELPALTRAISRQYDLFQTSLETLEKEQKFLNYGYTLSRKDSYEQRQERLCLEVFDAAQIQERDTVIDVGFGSGEQDFLLHRTRPFTRLDGFNIAEKQVRFANRRAAEAKLERKLSFHLGQAEVLPGVLNASVDKLLAIECAFYFDRPRFYRRAAEVLKPGGRAVLADISLSDRLGFLGRRFQGFGRLGTQGANRALWEKHLKTKSVRSINRWTWPGAQMTVAKILRLAPHSAVGSAERREWLSMAFYSQLVALGLIVNLVHYDLIVLEKSVFQDRGQTFPVP
jgi:cyclopropane fatty-acyl-phospholipid synthase-like methyltransferase